MLPEGEPGRQCSLGAQVLENGAQLVESGRS
jgi:hypothetical protein